LREWRYATPVRDAECEWPRSANRGRLRGQTAAECDAMRRVTITNNPADEEFWQFEERVKVQALVGIPGNLTSRA